MRRVSGLVVRGEALDVLRALPAGSIDLVYVDPPFNTGKVQRRARMKVERDAAGDRKGFGGRRYRTVKVAGAAGFADSFDDYLGWLEPHLIETRRVLAATGSFYFHIDYREAHYCKVLIDRILRR